MATKKKNDSKFVRNKDKQPEVNGSRKSPKQKPVKKIPKPIVKVD